MSNIITLVWDGATDDNMIILYEIQWRLSQSTPWSEPILVNHDPNYSTNTVNSGGGIYTHVATQLIPHYFRIRTVDNIGQYSGYKEILTGPDENTILISSRGSLFYNTVCIEHSMTPVNPIILTDNLGNITNEIVLNMTYVKNTNYGLFNGSNRYWRIVSYLINYNCKIDTIGKIISVEPCNSTIRTEFISNSSNTNSINSDICNFQLNIPVYYIGDLSLYIGLVIYTTLGTDGILSNPVVGGTPIMPKYYLISENINVYVVEISSYGNILSIQDYTAVCPI